MSNAWILAPIVVIDVLFVFNLAVHCKSGSFEKYLNQLYSTDQIAMVWFCENHH